MWVNKEWLLQTFFEKNNVTNIFQKNNITTNTMNILYKVKLNGKEKKDLHGNHSTYLSSLPWKYLQILLTL